MSTASLIHECLMDTRVADSLILNFKTKWSLHVTRIIILPIALEYQVLMDFQRMVVLYFKVKDMKKLLIFLE